MKLLALVPGFAALTAVGALTLSGVLSAERARSLDGGRLVTALDGEPVLAARAALAIGRTKDEAGAPALRAHLDAHDVTLRAFSAYGLGLLEDRASLDRLRVLAGADPNSAVRYAAVDAIGRIAAAFPTAGAPVAAASDLLAVVRHDADPVVRAHAAINLDAFRGTAAGQTVAFGLTSAFKREASDDVRWHIMWVLARAYPLQTNRAFLLGLLSDSHDLIRIEAIHALARGNEASVTRAIEPLLHDPSWRVAEEASEALRRLTGQTPTDHLKAVPDVTLPPVAKLPEEALPTQPRPSPSGKPVAPADGDALLTPTLMPTSAAQMNGPMPGLHPRVRVTTTQGTFVVRLYPEWAPYTVANFLNLTNRGYFDDNRWFRIVPNFVVQTGDPTNTGDGDAGYTIPAEENPVEQRAGIISMGLNYDDKTNTPMRDSAGTQWYITLSPQLHLDRSFTVFGEVEGGFDALAHLAESDKIERLEQIADD